MTQSIIPIGSLQAPISLNSSQEVALDMCSVPKWSAATNSTKEITLFGIGFELDDFVSRRKLLGDCNATVCLKRVVEVLLAYMISWSSMVIRFQTDMVIPSQCVWITLCSLKSGS